MPISARPTAVYEPRSQPEQAAGGMVSNGPTENLNLKINSSKRITRGYRNFVHYQP